MKNFINSTKNYFLLIVAAGKNWQLHFLTFTHNLKTPADLSVM